MFYWWILWQIKTHDDIDDQIRVALNFNHSWKQYMVRRLRDQERSLICK